MEGSIRIRARDDFPEITLPMTGPIAFDANLGCECLGVVTLIVVPTVQTLNQRPPLLRHELLENRGIGILVLQYHLIDDGIQVDGILLAFREVSISVAWKEEGLYRSLVALKNAMNYNRSLSTPPVSRQTGILRVGKSCLCFRSLETAHLCRLAQ